MHVPCLNPQGQKQPSRLKFKNGHAACSPNPALRRLGAGLTGHLRWGSKTIEKTIKENAQTKPTKQDQWTVLISCTGHLFPPRVSCRGVHVGPPRRGTRAGVQAPLHKEKRAKYNCIEGLTQAIQFERHDTQKVVHAFEHIALEELQPAVQYLTPSRATRVYIDKPCCTN